MDSSYQNPAWMNSDIREAMRCRDRYKEKGDFTNYRIWRNKVVMLIKKAKKNLYVKTLNENKKNPSKLWKCMKEVCPDEQQNSPNMLKVENEVITDIGEIVNKFNSHFSNIAGIHMPTKRSSLDPKYHNELKTFVDSKTGGTDRGFSIPPINSDFIVKQLQSIDNKKAVGLDGLNVKLLKQTAPAIVASLTKICNLSIETGVFPSQWKQARITPIHKGGPKDDCSNYRPISILPVLSKILEKHVFIHLYQYLCDQKLLADSQYGFRKNHSCQTALINLTEKMYNAIKNGRLFGVVQLDLKKAFDLVNHKLLLEKLSIYKCNKAATDWFESYLTERYQHVKIKKYQSEPQLVTSGVPQGSILGPLLFLLYINDLILHISDSCELLLYADDTTLTTSSINLKHIESTLSCDTQNVKTWCVNNDMLLSDPKCIAMLFQTKQRMRRTENSEPMTVKIGEHILPTVSSSKILGVNFDSHLTWEEHINQIHGKVIKLLYLLKQIKPYLPLEARKLFYNAYILPHFDFCAVIWGNCSETLFNDLYKLQKKAARLILNADFTQRSKDLFSKLGWMPLADRIRYHQAIQMYKCLNKQCPQNLQESFSKTADVHNYTTRSVSNHSLYVPKTHAKSFLSIGTKTWNNIPLPIRNSTNLATFRRLYLNHYFRNNSHL